MRAAAVLLVTTRSALCPHSAAATASTVVPSVRNTKDHSGTRAAAAVAMAAFAAAFSMCRSA
jgi:hypothetical protein